MTDCTFTQSKLPGASFNGAALTWTEAPPEDLYEARYDENGEYEGSSQIAYGPFDQADLTGTSFASVFFKNADFRNADGVLAADFTGAQGLEEAHFDTDEIKSEVIRLSRASSTTTDTGEAK